MRVRTLSLVALAAVAGLSLTACQSNDDNASSGTNDSSSAPQGSSAAQGEGGNNGNSGNGGEAEGATGGGATAASNAGTDTGAASADTCKTSQLAFSSSHGMGEGELVVSLKNTGSAKCVMQGFPGVDLKGKDGTISATRSKQTASKVSLEPGGQTSFILAYPPNTSGGSGVTFTTLVVTPPNETHSKSLPATVNIAVTDGSSTGTGITVNPVGYGSKYN